MRLDTGRHGEKSTAGGDFASVESGVPAVGVVSEDQVAVLDVEQVPAERVAVGDEDAFVTRRVAVEFDGDGEVAVCDQALGTVALQGRSAGEDADLVAEAGFLGAA